METMLQYMALQKKKSYAFQEINDPKFVVGILGGTTSSQE